MCCAKLSLALLLGAIAVVPIACKAGGSVQCDDSSNCDLSSGGMCLGNPGTTHQWCGYPDAECPSGYRWSELDVGDGVGGRCVDARALDKTPPIITGRTPAPESQQVSPAEVISVTFSEAIEPSSVTAASIRLEDQGGRGTEVAFVTRDAEVVLTPKVPLDPRLSYRVTVTPEVTDLAGNGLPETSSWEFRTRDATWSAPVFLENEQSKKAVHIELASANGVLVATWAFATCVGTTCGLANEVWVAVRKGGIWAAPVKLSTAADRVGLSAIAVNQAGRVLVMWSQGGASTPGEMLAATYDGASWTAPVVVDRNPGGFMTPWAIAPQGDEAMVVLWSNTTIPLGQVLSSSLYRFGSGFAPASLVDTFRENLGTPTLTLNNTRSMVVWENRQVHKISTRDFQAGGWSAPQTVADLSVNPKFVSASAFDNESTVIWATDHVFARRKSDGQWDATIQLDTAAGTPPGDVPVGARPIGYLSSGTVVALWASDTDAWQAIRPVGQPWSPSFAIDDASQPVEDLQLAVGRSRALALWRNTDLRVNEFSEAAGWRGAGNAESSPLPITDAAVTYDDATNTFVAVWLQTNAAGLVDVVSSVYR